MHCCNANANICAVLLLYTPSESRRGNFSDTPYTIVLAIDHNMFVSHCMLARVDVELALLGAGDATSSFATPLLVAIIDFHDHHGAIADVEGTGNVTRSQSDNMCCWSKIKFKKISSEE